MDFGLLTGAGFFVFLFLILSALKLRWQGDTGINKTRWYLDTWNQTKEIGPGVCYLFMASCCQATCPLRRPEMLSILVGKILMVQLNGERGLRGIICSKASLPGSVCSFALLKAFWNPVNGKQETRAQEFHKVTKPRHSDQIQSEGRLQGFYQLFERDSQGAGRE